MLGLLCAPASPAAADCTAGQVERALAEVRKAVDWEGLHAAYRHYPGCDDGAVAEAFADRVIELLSAQWDSLPRLAVLVAWDEAFASFVVDHIDASADPADLARIVVRAADRGCLGLTGRMCDAIRDKAVSVRNAPRASGAR